MRHSRLPALVLVLVLAAACSGDVATPSTAGGGTATVPSATSPPDTAGGEPGVPRPDRWFGVQDGTLVVAEGGEAAPVVEPGAIDEFGEFPFLVRLGAETLFVSFCCEPAEGESAAVDLTGGTVFESWAGIVTSVTGDDASARVLTNGMQVLVEAPGADPLATGPREFLLPGHVGLSPDGGSMAVVGAGLGEDVLYALAPGTAFFEDGTELARGRQDRVTPVLPAIDSDGMVWWVRERRRADERIEGVVTDPATGEHVRTFEHPKSIVDQDFDASGTWLLVTYADGTLGWRSITGETGDLPGQGWTTADW